MTLNSVDNKHLFCEFEQRLDMARVCDVTGKKTTTGNNVSHAKNRTRRKFLPNLQNRKIWVESENRWISMKISGAALRTIDKLGIDEILKRMRADGKKV